jgi:hypothetical protein
VSAGLVKERNRCVISRYTDLPHLSRNTEAVHLRKFVSRDLLREIFDRCPELKIISMSNYAYRRACSSGLLHILMRKHIHVEILGRGPGRPNLIEK